MGVEDALNTNGLETLKILGNIVARLPNTSSDIPYEKKSPLNIAIFDSIWGSKLFRNDIFYFIHRPGSFDYIYY